MDEIIIVDDFGARSTANYPLLPYLDGNDGPLVQVPGDLGERFSKGWAEGACDRHGSALFYAKIGLLIRSN
jgi:hypothetical protein